MTITQISPQHSHVHHFAGGAESASKMIFIGFIARYQDHHDCDYSDRQVTVTVK